MKTWVPSPTLHEPGMVLQAYCPSTQEIEAGGSESQVQDHLQLYIQFKAHLSYLRLCLRWGGGSHIRVCLRRVWCVGPQSWGKGMGLAMIGLLLEAKFSGSGLVLMPLNVAPAILPDTTQALRNYLLTFISGSR